MIVGFRNRGTEDVFHNEDTKAARKTCPKSIWRVAQRKLDYLQAAAVLSDLRIPPQNKLEKLKRDRAGQHAIRINDQYRICFIWTDKGPDEVEITDYH
ncbi:MAG TPA: type II toxin-antitoxin system RelE/ParE family toxin [Gemmatimonadaceae bacterium]|nr:type II toxin-antitoxin system RelE/ParE family toxin [Gemmatimonadaceae bacterium]